MAITTRTGKVWLLKDIPFDKEYNHTMYFANASSQNSWICHADHVIGSSNPKENQNQIKDPLHGTIRLQAHQENYLGCCYICFKNTSIDGTLPATHTYNYAFVDDCRFVSNEVLEIDYTIDVFQTYLFQGGCELKECYVLRENINKKDDVKGANLEPEPCTFGEYKLEKLSSLIVDTSWKWVVYAPFDVHNPPTWNDNVPTKMNGMAGGVLQGLLSYSYESYTDMEDDIENMDSRLAEKIVAIVAMPSAFVGSGKLGAVQTNIKDENTTLPSSIDGYTPVNNKLWTAPFNTLLLTNTHGGNRTLRFEYFDNPKNISFHLVLGISPNPELMCAPNYYGHGYTQSAKTNYAEAISISDFPHVAWTGNGFLSWFATTGQHSIVDMLGGFIGGLFNPSPSNIVSQMVDFSHTAIDASNASFNSQKGYGNTGGSTALMADGAVNIYTFQQCVNNKDAERIDHFFTKYGYAINRLKKPSYTNTKYYHHFVQTQNCIVSGGAPASVMDTIKNAFNKGITFWDESDATASKFGNYVNNDTGAIITR